MRLSTRARYGLRALFAISQGDGEAISSEKISRRQAISKKYLDELLRSLRQHGFVRTVRGRHGGYMLGRTPQEITVLAVVECLDGPIRLAPCVDQDDVCPRTEGCPTRPIWQTATKGIRDILGGMSLATLMESPMHGEACVELLTSHANPPRDARSELDPNE